MWYLEGLMVIFEYNCIGKKNYFVIPVKLVLAKAGNRNPVFCTGMDSASSAE